MPAGTDDPTPDEKRSTPSPVWTPEELAWMHAQVDQISITVGPVTYGGTVGRGGPIEVRPQRIETDNGSLADSSEPDSSKATTGLLAYYDLDAWWQSALTLSERQRVESLFHPPYYEQARPLTEGTFRHVAGATDTPAGFLSTLRSWLGSTPEDNAIRRKIRDTFAELTAFESDVVSRHFALSGLISEYYRDRNCDPKALPAAIAACRQQIALAPAVADVMRPDYPDRLPRHIGYERLAVILEKNKGYDEAIRLCEEAKRAGWRPGPNDDWDKRATRCAARKAKAMSGSRR